MWEKFKDWFASDRFVWFMLGWVSSELLYNPSLINLILVGFWIWVLSSDNA
jgi:hypothetical protein